MHVVSDLVMGAAFELGTMIVSSALGDAGQSVVIF